MVESRSLGRERAGRCHDVKNRFIVDGSIWVTSGGVNPISTIQALALYIADTIKNYSTELRLHSEASPRVPTVGGGGGGGGGGACTGHAALPKPPTGLCQNAWIPGTSPGHDGF